jgi:hypothetical protein
MNKRGGSDPHFPHDFLQLLMMYSVDAHNAMSPDIQSRQLVSESLHVPRGSENHIGIEEIQFFTMARNVLA